MAPRGSIGGGRRGIPATAARWRARRPRLAHSVARVYGYEGARETRHRPERPHPQSEGAGSPMPHHRSILLERLGASVGNAQ